jgi:hypothetical protein
MRYWLQMNKICYSETKVSIFISFTGVTISDYLRDEQIPVQTKHLL